MYYSRRKIRSAAEGKPKGVDPADVVNEQAPLDPENEQKIHKDKGVDPADEVNKQAPLDPENEQKIHKDKGVDPAEAVDEQVSLDLQKLNDLTSRRNIQKASSSVDPRQKVDEGDCLGPRNRLPTIRFEIEGFEESKKSCALSKQEAQKQSNLIKPFILKESKKSCALSKQEAQKQSNLYKPFISENTNSQSASRVCIISHADMLKHQSKTNEYEIPDRLNGIMKTIIDDGLLERCDFFLSETAKPEHLEAVHVPEYLNFIPNTKLTNAKKKLYQNFIGEVYFSEGSKDAAFLAAGSVVQACKLVSEDRYSAAFALVRPPGHHALPSKADGFCILGNVAIGAKHLLSKGMKKILIVDIDVHHGNGSQKIFYHDDQVMVISIHSSTLDYPDDAEEPLNRTIECIGEGAGLGYNVNINLDKGYGDPDAFYVLEQIILPLASAFEPEMILISAGYDALKDDTLGDAALTVEFRLGNNCPYASKGEHRTHCSFSRGWLCNRTDSEGCFIHPSCSSWG